MSLRDEFEPFNLSPEGLHSNRHKPVGISCALAWKKETWPDEVIAWQLELAVQWLERSNPTGRPNPRAGTSYGLKHDAEHWHRVRGVENPYICNGAFLMAAQRLRFKMAPVTFPGGTYLAWINISIKKLHKPGF